uniref:ANF_receptor domain-containing protein n=1 Tax=Caenorhabditis japonica TaxID=281687 RepID=A0A8R1E0U5_CAEJA
MFCCNCKIHVGIAAALEFQPASIGWAYSGGAVPLAVQYLQSHGFLTNFDFEFHVEYTECDIASTVRAGLKFMSTLDYDVIIGPPCAQALKVMGTLSNIFKKPVLGWGFVSESELSDKSRLGIAASELLQLFSWNRVALLFYANELNYCNSVIDDVESKLNDPNGYPVKIVMKGEIDSKDNGS